MHYKIVKKFEARKTLNHSVEEYPLALIADFGFGKVVLRAETRFAIIELCRKIEEFEFLLFLLGKKCHSYVFLK